MAQPVHPHQTIRMGTTFLTSLPIMLSKIVPADHSSRTIRKEDLSFWWNLSTTCYYSSERQHGLSQGIVRLLSVYRLLEDFTFSFRNGSIVPASTSIVAHGLSFIKKFQVRDNQSLQS
jgi:hypothetical protein